jgi:hypothetical protein
MRPSAELSSTASADDRELCQGKENQGCDHIRNPTMHARHPLKLASPVLCAKRWTPALSFVYRAIDTAL